MEHFNRIFNAVLSGFVAAQIALLTRLGLLKQPVLVPVRSRRRGAGMLEYALVALISIAVFGVLIEQFTGIFSSLASTIGDKLGGE